MNQNKVYVKSFRTIFRITKFSLKLVFNPIFKRRAREFNPFCECINHESEVRGNRGQRGANLVKSKFHLTTTKFGAQGNFDAVNSKMGFLYLNFLFKRLKLGGKGGKGVGNLTKK